MELSELFDELYDAYAGNLVESGALFGGLCQHFALPRNAHYVSLARYQAVLSGRSATTAKYRAFAGSLARVVRARASNGSQQPTQFEHSADCLFVSHYLGSPAESDPYYGELLRTGREPSTSWVCYLNHTWQSPDAIQQRIAKLNPQACIIPPEQRTVLPRDVPLGVMLRAFSELGRHARFIASRMESPALAAHIRANALDAQNVFGIALVHHARQLLRSLKPRFLILTWEGHAWERALIAAAREECPGLSVIAYHHGPLFPLTVSAARPTVYEADPDALMVTGAHIAQHYASTPLWQDKPIAVVGSPRAATTAPYPVADRSTLLVLPEGVLEETVALFRLAVDAIAEVPGLRVILRVHPVIDPKAVLRFMPELERVGGSVQLSAQSLSNDIAEARWMLYRGSTAAFEGLLSGLRPFVFQGKGDPYPLDSLKEPGDWQMTVENAGDLVDAIAADQATSQSRRQALFDKAAAHVGGLVSPVDVEAANNVLSDLTMKKCRRHDN